MSQYDCGRARAWDNNSIDEICPWCLGLFPDRGLCPDRGLSPDRGLAGILRVPEDPDPVLATVCKRVPTSAVSLLLRLEMEEAACDRVFLGEFDHLGLDDSDTLSEELDLKTGVVGV